MNHDGSRGDRGDRPSLLAGLRRLTAALLLALPLAAGAEARYTASQGDVLVTLYDDKCQLAEVTNLPARAVWFEKGQAVEGCWSPHPHGYAVAYFADKTVVLIPFDQIKKAQAV